MEIKLGIEREGDWWALVVSVCLSKPESSLLFQNDPLISWPTDDVACDERCPVVRGCMYLSEVAGRSDGLRVVFTGEEPARRAGLIIGHQLTSWGKGIESA